ncbi:MAG: outer membrane protein assembly factor BamD [Kiritimatiellae bacterium]|nr:outer membrane protein assembly factor BamD [Kiritimatiellia bacterium]
MTPRRTIATFLAACLAVSQPALAETADKEAAALFASGVAAFNDGRPDAAMLSFKTLACDFPQSKLAAPARFMQAKSLVAMARFEDAVVVLDAFIENSPSSPLVSDALMLRGESLVAASALAPHFREAAISFSMAMESDDISRSQRGRAAYRLLDTLLRMGDDESARRAAADLTERELLEVARIAAAERNFRLARIYGATPNQQPHQSP